MTDVLAPRPTRRATAPSNSGRRPLAVGALLAGLAAPSAGIVLLWALGLVAWYADDGGAHGTTRSVLRVAADAWLLAHGAHLHVGAVVVSASPLGLTLLCGLVTYRFGRWAGRGSTVDGLGSVGLATVVLAGVYAVVALLVSLLASIPGAQPGLGLSFSGGAAVGALAGGAGLVRGAGLAGDLRARIPVPVLSAAATATGAVLLTVAAGALLGAVGLAWHASAAANVAESLHLDVTGGLLSLLLLAGMLPNVSLLGAAYLLGPGFAVGVGTVVSPAEVSLGPVPALPVLAALPPDGWAPGWVSGSLAVPVGMSLLAALLAGRALPTTSWQAGALRGVAGGAGGALALALAVSQAGGGVGPGRMAELGAGFDDVLVPAVLALGSGGLVGGLVATWWARRRRVADAAHPARMRRPRPARPMLPGRPHRLTGSGRTAEPKGAAEETVRLRRDADPRR